MTSLELINQYCGELLESEVGHRTQLEKENRVLEKLWNQLGSSISAYERGHLVQQQPATDVKESTDEKKHEEKSLPLVAELKLVDDILKKAQKVRTGAQEEEKVKSDRGCHENPLKKTLSSASRTRPHSKIRNPIQMKTTQHSKTKPQTLITAKRVAVTKANTKKRITAKPSASTFSSNLPSGSEIRDNSETERPGPIEGSSQDAFAAKPETDHRPNVAEIPNDKQKLMTRVYKSLRKHRHVGRALRNRKEGNKEGAVFLSQLEQKCDKELDVRFALVQNVREMIEEDHSKGCSTNLMEILQDYQDIKGATAQVMEKLDLFSVLQKISTISEINVKDYKQLQSILFKILEIELLDVTYKINQHFMFLAQAALSNPEIPDREKIKIYRLAYGHICGGGRRYPSMIRDEFDQEDKDIT